MPYSLHKGGVLIALVLYLLFGLTSNTADGSSERYPFFNWQLFSYIPNEKDDYSIEIYRIGEQAYDPPLQYKDMTQLFYAVDASPTEYTPHIRRLANALQDEDYTSVAQHRAALETIFRGKTFSYGLLEVHLDPVEFWRTEEYERKEVIRVFNSISQ